MTIKDELFQFQAEIGEFGDIAVLTENFDDNIFWSRILRKVLGNKKLYFYNNPNGITGKAILKKYESVIGSNCVICYDSDNEFLWSNKEPLTTPLTTPYIYETFVYSFENYSFDSNALNDLIYSMTNEDYDINKPFLETYTQYVADLFYWWIFFKKYGKAYRLSSNPILRPLANTEGDFLDYLNFDVEKMETIDNLDDILHKVYQNVENYFEQIKNEIPPKQYDDILKSDITNLKEYFKNHYSIEKSDIIYFLQGHSVEKIFKPFLKKLISALQKNHIVHIQNTVKKKPEERIKKYKKDFETKDFNTKIDENYTYQLTYPNKFFQKIIDAIERDFKKV